ncbi:MAG TPA: CopD family protein [Thermomicrobiales bacterium]|nr:CopD family protein [Thermomicrobiales bacterium]
MPGGEGVPRVPHPASRVPTVALVTLLLVALALLPESASAHAALLRSDPAGSVSLAEGPESISLWFSEAVELDYSRIQVLRSDGSRVSAGVLQRRDDGPDPALLLPLRDELGRGSYTVVWSVLSSVDGHVTEGFFSFTVGDALLPSAADEAELARQAAGEAGVPGGAEGLARWLGLLGQATIAGVLVFLLLALLPVARAVGDAPPDARRYRLLFGAALTALTVGQLAAAVVQTMNAARLGLSAALGEPLFDLLSGTRYGAQWLSRSTLIVALGLVVWALTRRERLVTPRGRGRLLWGLALVVSGLVLLTASLGSHAAARSGTRSWQVANDWLHLAGTSAWVGGLVGLLVSLPGLATAERRMLQPVLARFSLLAMGSVALLAVTGVLAARESVGGWDGLTTTEYGTWFLLKLVIVVATLGLAAYHLLVTRPELDVRARAATAALRFRRSLRVEASLALGVLAAAAMLTVTPPGRDLLDRGGVVFATTRLTPEMSLTLRIDPGQVGVNEFAVDIGPVEPETFGELQSVDLRFTPLDAGGKGAPSDSQRVQLPQSGPGDAFAFQGAGSYLALEGRWEVSAIVKRAGTPDVEVPFQLVATSDGVRPAGAPVADNSRSGFADRATLLGGLWLVAAVALGSAGWRLLGSQRVAAWGLLSLSGATLLLGAVLLVLGGPGGT